MWNQFFLENIHFTVNIFAALVFFAVFWLYFDAWRDKRNTREIPKILGFILLSLSYLFSATIIESTILPASYFTGDLLPTLFLMFRISGYLLLAWGLLVKPLQKHPKHDGLKEKITDAAPILFFASLGLVESLKVFFPFASFAIAILYLRRATKGLERHLKPIALSFFIATAHEIISLTSFFQDTTNVDLYNLVAPFGPLWIAKQAILFLAAGVLGYWVWGYLLRRIVTQLFMIFTLSFLIIFLVTTVSFTGLLLKNLQDETLSRLDTDVKVLSFAIDSKKEELLSDAEVLAKDTQVQEGIGDTEAQVALAKISESFLVSKKLTTLVIVDENGQVVARGEDSERVGVALIEPMLGRALDGETLASVVVKDGVIAPEVSIRSVVPVKRGDEIVGAIMVGEVLDNAFVDAVKRATELEAGIYGNNVLSASTILAPDGRSFWVGTKQEDSRLLTAVLEKGESFTGPVSIFNTEYFGAYLALKDVDEVPVGMLFVGKPQVIVLQTAGRSIELTFLIASALIAISIIPAYLTSRYIAYQVR